MRGQILGVFYRARDALEELNNARLVGLNAPLLLAVGFLVICHKSLHLLFMLHKLKVLLPLLVCGSIEKEESP